MNFFYFSADAGEDPEHEVPPAAGGCSLCRPQRFRRGLDPRATLPRLRWALPNPAVTGAAVAAITENVEDPCRQRGAAAAPPGARRGGMVGRRQPLPRASGRVGRRRLAAQRFRAASRGLRERKAGMFDSIETVRKLWRGDSVKLPGPKGDVAVTTLPRPLQAELPIWVTSAGSTETSMAGEAGCNVLTHLLGQTVPEVGEKVAAYRAAWRKAGHAGQGIVSLMLHTFVSDDDEAIRDRARSDEGLPANRDEPRPGSGLAFPTLAEAWEELRRGVRERLLRGRAGCRARVRVRALLRDQRSVRSPESCSDMVERRSPRSTSTRSPV